MNPLSKVVHFTSIRAGSVQALNANDLDGNFHNFVVNYDGPSRTLTVNYTETNGTVLTWRTVVATTSQAMSMLVSASTGVATNLQQLRLTSFDFQQDATVNVKYVDTQGKQIGQSEVAYPNGAAVSGTYDTSKLSISNYTFVKMDDGAVTGTKSLPTTGTLTQTGNNGTVVYVYAPAYTAQIKTVHETINYLKDSGEAIAAAYQSEPIAVLTVLNPVTNLSTKYYKVGTSNVIPSLDSNGQPDNTWVSRTQVLFSSVINPIIPGYHVINTADQTQNLSQVSSQFVNEDNSDSVFSVTYAANIETAQINYIDDATGKVLYTQNLSGLYNTTNRYDTLTTIQNYINQGYQLVSDNFLTAGVVYDQDGIMKTYNIHLVSVKTPIGMLPSPNVLGDSKSLVGTTTTSNANVNEPLNAAVTTRKATLTTPLLPKTGAHYAKMSSTFNAILVVFGVGLLLLIIKLEKKITRS